MKKLLFWFTLLGLLIPTVAFATQITVPSAPGTGYMLISTTTGAYIATTTSSVVPSFFSYPFPSNATSTLLTFNGGLTAANNVTLSGITGSTQCLHVSSSGVISGTGSDCGTGSGGVTSFNTRTGAVTLSSSDVTTALGFTPFGGTNPLPVANGGTGSSTLGGILIGNGISAVNSVTVGSGLSLTGTTLSATGGSGTYPFTPTSHFGVTMSATGTPIWDTAGLFASSTSYFDTAIMTNGTSTNAFGIGDYQHIWRSAPDYLDTQNVGSTNPYTETRNLSNLAVAANGAESTNSMVVDCSGLNAFNNQNFLDTSVDDYPTSYNYILAGVAAGTCASIPFEFQDRQSGGNVNRSNFMVAFANGTVGMTGDATSTVTLSTRLEVASSTAKEILEVEGTPGTATTLGTSYLTVTGSSNTVGAGRIGIGTSSPVDMIAASVGNNQGLTIDSTNAAFIGVGEGGADRWRIENNFSNTGLLEFLYNNGAGNAPSNSLLTLTGTGATGIVGHVGIATTSPSQVLSVVGTGYFTGGIRFGDGTVQTTAATGGSGSPGGASSTVQYNNNGVFSGITDATTDGTNPIFYGIAATGVTGTGKMVYSIAPAFTSTATFVNATISNILTAPTLQGGTGLSSTITVQGTNSASASSPVLTIGAAPQTTSSVFSTYTKTGMGLGTTSPYAALSLGGGNLVLGAATAGGTPGDLFLPKLGTSAGTFLAVDATGKVIATTTPSGGGAVSSVSNSDGTLTISPTTGDVVASLALAHANTWTGLQTFGNSSTTLGSFSYASSTLGFFGTLTIPNLGTSAGAFLAVNASGQVIATTTPSGSFVNTLANGGTATTTFYNGGVVFSDGTKLTQAANALSNSFVWDNTDGVVGIGTTTPAGTGASALALQGTNPQLAWAGNGGSAVIGGSLGSTAGGATTLASNGNLTVKSSTGSILFQTNSTEAARLTTANRFGLGTTTPYGELSISAPAGTAPYFVIGSSTGEVLNVSPSANPFFGLGTTSPFATLSAIGNGTNPIFAVATTTNNGLPNFEIDVNGHVVTSGSTPVLSTCGTGTPTAQGNDTNFRVVTETGASSCTATFAKTYVLAPICIATEESGTNAIVGASSTPTTVVLTFASSLTGKEVAVHCEGYQ